MVLDDDIPLGELVDSPAELRRQMTEVSKLSQSCDALHRWASHLRFVVPLQVPTQSNHNRSCGRSCSSCLKENVNSRLHPPSNIAHFDQESEIAGCHRRVVPEINKRFNRDNCSNCSTAITFSDHAGRDLAVFESEAVTKCGHYVAVSYRWSDPKKKEMQAEKHFRIHRRRESKKWQNSHTAHPTPFHHGGHPHSASISRLDAAEPRFNEARSDVIRRAIAFAGSHGLSHIWIDQECIQKRDKDDKEHGIQAMDLVYRKSKFPLGLLECTITTQEQIEALMFLVHGPHRCADRRDKQRSHPGSMFLEERRQWVRKAVRYSRSLLNVLDMISNDVWFKRSWILQESISGGPDMTLLIRHDPGLRKCECLGSIPGEACLSMRTFHRIVDRAYNTGFGLFQNLLGDRIHQQSTEDALLVELLQKGLRTVVRQLRQLIPKDPVYSLPKNPESGGSYSASQAMAYLSKRENSRVADRLAILANMCDFQTRLNTQQAEADTALTDAHENRHSFSVCVLTLALMNGDVSLLTGKRLDLRAISSRWSKLSTFTLSELYDTDPFVTYRLTSVTPTLDGLAVRGRLWKKDRDIDISVIKGYLDKHEIIKSLRHELRRKKLAVLIHQYIRTWTRPRDRNYKLEGKFLVSVWKIERAVEKANVLPYIFWLVISKLLHDGEADAADLIWHFTRRRGFDNLPWRASDLFTSSRELFIVRPDEEHQALPSPGIFAGLFEPFLEETPPDQVEFARFLLTEGRIPIYHTNRIGITDVSLESCTLGSKSARPRMPSRSRGEVKRRKFDQELRVQPPGTQFGSPQDGQHCKTSSNVRIFFDYEKQGQIFTPEVVCHDDIRQRRFNSKDLCWHVDISERPAPRDASTSVTAETHHVMLGKPIGGFYHPIDDVVGDSISTVVLCHSEDI